MKYEITIVYKGQSSFVVEADSKNEAQDTAIALYKNDIKGVQRKGASETIDYIEITEYNNSPG